MKFIYLTLGFIFLSLGIIGIYLPFIPTTPFILLSLLFFSKSSDKYYNKLKNSKFYKENIDPIKERKAMPLNKKIKILAIISILFLKSFYFMHNKIGRIVVIVILIFHYIYFGFFIKTKKAKH